MQQTHEGGRMVWRMQLATFPELSAEEEDEWRRHPNWHMHGRSVHPY